MLLKNIRITLQNVPPIYGGVRFLRILSVGDKVSVTKKISEEDVQRFAEISGDVNPIHITTSTQKGIVHGAYLNSLVSGVIGTKLPGPGTMLISQTLNFPNKCYVGENVVVNVELKKNRKIKTVHFECTVKDDNVNKVVLNGDATLIVNT